MSERLARALSAKERAVVDHLLARGPLSKPALARSAAMSRPAMGDLVSRLEALGVVREAGASAVLGPGPNAMRYRVVADLAHVIGIEMHPASVRACVSDLAGEPLAEVYLDTAGAAGPVDGAHTAVRQVCERAGLRIGQVSLVVIGVPGVVDPVGEIDFVWGHPGWRHGQRARLADALGCPVQLENDMNLAAVAEHQAGAGQGVDSLAVIRCDEGVGAAFVLGGEIVRGARGFAGELGLAPFGDEATRSHDHAGRDALAAVLRAMGVDDATPEDMLRDPARHPERNDAFLHEVARRCAHLCLLVSAVIDPRRTLLTGSIADAGGARLIAAIEARIQERSVLRIDVGRSAFDRNAVVVGALLTGLRRARDELYGGESAVRPPPGGLDGPRASAQPLDPDLAVTTTTHSS